MLTTSSKSTITCSQHMFLCRALTCAGECVTASAVAEHRYCYMNNGMSRSIKCITSWAYFASGISQQFTSSPRRAVTTWRGLQPAASGYLVYGTIRHPTAAITLKHVEFRWLRGLQARSRVHIPAHCSNRIGWFAQGWLLAHSVLWRAQQHYHPHHVLVTFLAATGVPGALALLSSVLNVAPSSLCPPVHPISTALDVVPVALWPRLMFYSRVCLRMVVLFSILSPLIILYPLSQWHPHARTLWLGLLRLSLRWCGPAFTKWAQWASARGDLMPLDVRAVLETLQNAAPTQPPADTLRTLQRSLPMPVDEVFSYIDMEPAGCGAIAQVHRAVLTPKAAALCGLSPGQEVAVKVKKRGVEGDLRTDFIIMQLLARLLAFVPVLRDLRFDDSMSQFGVPLHQQLDFELEAHNLAQFTANFRNCSSVVFPQPLWPFVGRDLLLETYLPGRIVRHYVSSQHPLNKRIAQIGVDAFLQMMLVDNWQHADLHPGNIIVLESQASPAPALLAQAMGALFKLAGFSPPQWSSTDTKLGIIDVGMTVSLQRRHFLALVQLYDGISALDGTKIGNAMLQLRYHESSVRDLDLGAFRSDIEGVFRELDRQQFRHRTQEVCGYVLEAVRRHRVTMDAAASTVLFTTLALEGWANKLDPDIQILEKICALIS